LRFYDAAGNLRVVPEAGPVDWNGNRTIDSVPVPVDLDQINRLDVIPGHADWDYGYCTTSADCRINEVRLTLRDSLDPGASIRMSRACRTVVDRSGCPSTAHHGALTDQGQPRKMLRSA